MNKLLRPSFISKSLREDKKFKAEVKIFDIINEQSEKISGDFSSYYNCEFVTNTNNDGEIDFIVVIPTHGVAFLEVKGGGIKYDNDEDKWSSINSSGEMFEIKNPFNQSMRAEKFYSRKFQENTNLKKYWINTQHIVCFPDTNDPQKDLGLNAPNKLIIFRDDLDNFFKKIKDALHVKKQANASIVDSLGPPIMKQIDSIIKPSFVINPSFLTELEDESKEMQLTDSQIAILKILRYQKKVFIEGCAGTGKTIMAVQRAKEFAKDNKKVLILTHSRTLPINIRKKYFNNERMENLIITSAFQFTANLARKFNFDSRTILDEYPKERLFTEGYADLLMQLLDQKAQDENKYDAVIIDEGQRFTDEWWLAIDNLRKKDGYLYVFYDPNQTLKNSKTSDFLTEENANVYPLDINFRNTKTIFDLSKKLYKGFDILSAGPEGRPIEWIAVNTIDSQNKKIAFRLQQLLNEEIDMKDIAIINFGPVGEKNGLQNKLRELRIHAPLDGLEPQNREAKHISYDSVARYQGLEYKIVILTNFFTKDVNEENLNDLYIALTRSINHLIIIGSDKIFNDIKKLTS
jgi:superfamily I DNA and RNA helicase